MRLERPAARTAPGTNGTGQILSGLGDSGAGSSGSPGVREARSGRSRLKNSAIRDPSNCEHLACAGKDTQRGRKVAANARFPASGDLPKSLGFLDFAQRSPYTDPVFKLSVRPPTGGAARGAGRSDRRRRSRHVRAASSRPFTHRSACRAPGMIRGSAHRRTRVCQRERSRDF